MEVITDYYTTLPIPLNLTYILPPAEEVFLFLRKFSCAIISAHLIQPENSARYYCLFVCFGLGF